MVRQKRQIFPIIYIWLCFCVLSSFIWARSIQAAALVRVGYTMHPGFIELNEDGSYVGLGVEFFEGIASFTGWKYQYVPGTREELLAKLNNDEIDFIAPVVKTRARASTLYTYAQMPIGTSASALYVLENNNSIFFDDYQHMANMRVGGTPGSYQI